MSSVKLPAFIDDISNYLSGIKNLSNIYIKNLKITEEAKQEKLAIIIFKVLKEYNKNKK